MQPGTNIKYPSLIKQLMQEIWEHDAAKPEFRRTSDVSRGELNDDISEGLNASHLMKRSRNSIHLRASK